MTTMSVIEPFSPWSQMQQYGSALNTLITSIYEGSEESFCRSHVIKRDENGVAAPSRTYIEDCKTGNLYWDEEKDVIRIKCGGIAVVIIFYTAGKMACHAVKTPLHMVVIALETFVEVKRQYLFFRFYEGSMALQQGAVKWLSALGNGLFEIIKAPLCAFGVALSAIYGLFRPYEGRKCEALFEVVWQNGIPVGQDYCGIAERSHEECWQTFTNMHVFRPLYLALCFQVRHNTNEERIEIIRREALSS